MGSNRIPAAELHAPTKYRVDHGTMTLQPEKSIPTMQFTTAGYPPVFLRDGVFYDQGGNEYNMDSFPGGEEGFRKDHIEKADPAVLAQHGILLDGAPPASEKQKPDKSGIRAPKPSIFDPVDMSKDQENVLNAIGYEGMAIESIIDAAGIHAGRVRIAIEKLLGDTVERTGNGKRGDPYLYRRVVPNE